MNPSLWSVYMTDEYYWFGEVGEEYKMLGFPQGDLHIIGTIWVWFYVG
jgi:hypothetical protein